MPRPFQLLESMSTPEGVLELRKRGERDFMISIAGRVLMTSQMHRSELAVAQLACARLAKGATPRVLIGGLGLGFTLRAALDALPKRASVTVAELNEAVVRWCRAPAAVLTDGAVSDPRVSVVVGDVTDEIRRAASGGAGARFDAIVLDLYVGPGHAGTGLLYGREILARTYDALNPGGVYAVWGEEPSAPFEARLSAAGFVDVTLTRVGRRAPSGERAEARRVPSGVRVQGRRAPAGARADGRRAPAGARAGETGGPGHAVYLAQKAK